MSDVVSSSSTSFWQVQYQDLDDDLIEYKLCVRYKPRQNCVKCFFRFVHNTKRFTKEIDLEKELPPSSPLRDFVGDRIFIQICKVNEHMYIDYEGCSQAHQQPLGPNSVCEYCSHSARTSIDLYFFEGHHSLKLDYTVAVAKFQSRVTQTWSHCLECNRYGQLNYGLASIEEPLDFSFLDYYEKREYALKKCALAQDYFNNGCIYCFPIFVKVMYIVGSMYGFVANEYPTLFVFSCKEPFMAIGLIYGECRKTHERSSAHTSCLYKYEKALTSRMESIIKVQDWTAPSVFRVTLSSSLQKILQTLDRCIKNCFFKPTETPRLRL